VNNARFASQGNSFCVNKKLTSVFGRPGGSECGKTIYPLETTLFSGILHGCHSAMQLVALSKVHE
jgi:hypothetical protein